MRQRGREAKRETKKQRAQQRNKERDRILPPEMVEEMWHDVQQNIMKYQQIFGADKFFVIDNSGGLEDPTRAENFDNVYNNTQKFLNSPVGSKAQEWIDKAKENYFEVSC